MLWYHGSKNQFDEFKLKKGTYLNLNYINPIFLTSDYNFAKYYAGWDAYSRFNYSSIIYSVEVLTDKIFNPDKLPTDLDLSIFETKGIRKPNLNYELGLKLRDDIEKDASQLRDYPSRYYNNIVSGDFSSLEDVWFFEWLKNNDFDGCYVKETGARNLFIFNPNKLKIVGKEVPKNEERIVKFKNFLKS